MSRRIGFGSSVGRPIFLVGTHPLLSTEKSIVEFLPTKVKTVLKANENFLAEFLPYINSAGAGHAPRAGASTIFRYEAKVSKGSPKDTFGIRLGNDS